MGVLRWAETTCLDIYGAEDGGSEALRSRKSRNCIEELSKAFIFIDTNFVKFDRIHQNLSLKETHGARDQAAGEGQTEFGLSAGSTLELGRIGGF